MDTNTNKINRYLKSINLPEYESDRHRLDLRRQVLTIFERRHTMHQVKRFLKIAAMVVIMISAGAIATSVGIGVYHRYNFVGQDQDGRYLFAPEPTETNENGIVTQSGMFVSIDGPPGMDVEQERKDLEEIDLLRQQDSRELMVVIEHSVNGNLFSTFRFKYVLADGREKEIGEDDPDMLKSISPEQIEQNSQEFRPLRKRAFEEFPALREAGKYEDMDTYTKEIRGKTFLFKPQLYILSDGTEFIWSVGEPIDVQ
jgi:hypothetical protein